MPDERDEELADEETTPKTPLGAYKEGREEDVEGDPHPEVGEEGDKDVGLGNPVGGPKPESKDDDED